MHGTYLRLDITAPEGAAAVGSASDVNPQDPASLREGGSLRLSMTQFPPNFNPLHIDGNLAENAAKYGGGGIMRVYRNDAGEAVVEVTDDGPGVAADQLGKLTAPFFRADASRSQAHGAGLGLAIAQAIADGHGGRLELSNRTPRGFSAKLVLPA